MTKKLNFGFIIFDEVTQLDFTAPAQFIKRVPNLEMAVIAKYIKPVSTDCDFAIVPTHDFATAPPLDIICVPGGGVDAAITDKATIDYVRRTAQNCKIISSVCTGAFILGAAGLLQNKRATTHWAYLDLLPLVGAAPIDERVVQDGNIMTGGGVTSGIDFALTMIAEISDENIAKAIQLATQYDPAPPFDSGTPAKAGAKTYAALKPYYDKRVKELGTKLNNL